MASLNCKFNRLDYNHRHVYKEKFRFNELLGVHSDGDQRL